jgi:uncharacterized protein (DUF2336 family)
MIVRRFLQWVRTAAPGDRAEATGALARAYLYSDFSEHDRKAAQAALTLMLDDRAPVVRRALAEALGRSADAPHDIILALAHDAADIAAIVVERSPVLLEIELIEIVRAGRPGLRAAVAARPWVPESVSAVIIEVADAEVCRVLIENEGADIDEAALERLIARHGHVGTIREILLARADLTPRLRQSLVAKTAGALAVFVSERAWLEPAAAARVAREACERTTVTIARSAEGDEALELVRHLRATEQLTAGLLLRALLGGNRALFEAALAELSGFRLSRVAAILDDRSFATFTPLYLKAGLPASAEPLFRAVLAALHEVGTAHDPLAAAQLRRRMVERVLTHYRGNDPRQLDSYFALLRRYAAEAAREEARAFTADLQDADLHEADLEEAA